MFLCALIAFILCTQCCHVSCVPNVASVSGLSKFLIVPSVFSNVFFVLCLACSICQCLWIVHSCLPLQFSPRFICHVVCVSNVASVSGLSILVCPFNFLQGLFVMCFVYPMLPVSLDCPCLNTPSVFSNFCKVITHILLNVRRYTVKPALVTTSNKLQSNLL